VAFLLGERSVLPLLPATQDFSRQRAGQDVEQIHYEGGTMPLPDHLAIRTVELGRKAVTAVSGLRGYVGVDLVLRGQDHVIEINPRLTTSYIGLRALAKTNLAEAMLRVVEGHAGVTVDWNPGRIHFGPQGARRQQLIL
jgi:hypothetical protein